MITVRAEQLCTFIKVGGDADGWSRAPDSGHYSVVDHHLLVTLTCV